jgi:hypothetical protein
MDPRRGAAVAADRCPGRFAGRPGIAAACLARPNFPIAVLSFASFVAAPL